MIKRLILLLLYIFYMQPAICCINEYRARLNGDMIYTDGGGAIPYPRFNEKDTAYLSKQVNDADSIYHSTKALKDYSDYGAALVFDKQYLVVPQKVTLSLGNKN